MSSLTGKEGTVVEIDKFERVWIRPDPGWRMRGFNDKVWRAPFGLRDYQRASDKLTPVFICKDLC